MFKPGDLVTWKIPLSWEEAGLYLVLETRSDLVRLHSGRDKGSHWAIWTTLEVVNESR